jgi:hypothetical protein
MLQIWTKLISIRARQAPETPDTPHILPATGADLSGLHSLELAYEEARRLLDLQFNQIDGLDVKASVLMGSAGVVLTILLTWLPALFERAQPTRWLAAGSAVLACLSFLAGVCAIAFASYRTAPSMDALYKYIAEEPRNTKWQFLSNFKDDYEHNGKTIKWKVRIGWFSLFTLLFSLCCAIATSVWQLILSVH